MIVSGLLSACASDGRTLQPPAPGATAPPLPSSSTTSPPQIGTESDLVLGSPSFTDGGRLPQRHSCYGDGISPALQWSGVPAGTAELALIVSDLDEGGFLHWVVVGLDPALIGLGDGTVPEGALEARNDTSEFGWFGPCNDPNGDPHHYLFRLLALRAQSMLQPGVAGADAVSITQSLSLAQAELTVTYP